MKYLIAYLGIGVTLSLIAAPISWKMVFKGNPGNLPFWVGLWPWPIAAEIYKQITGEYPDWLPDL